MYKICVIYECVHLYCEKCYYDLMFIRKTRCMKCGSMCKKSNCITFVNTSELKKIILENCDFSYNGSKEKMCNKILEKLSITVEQLDDMITNNKTIKQIQSGGNVKQNITTAKTYEPVTAQLPNTQPCTNILETDTESKSNSATKLSAIPIGIKNQTWTTYIGKVFETDCPICDINIINVFNYECAHVIAQSKGGQHTVDNLRPICSPCNKRMNNNDFYEWTQKNYPKAKILKSFVIL